MRLGLILLSSFVFITSCNGQGKSNLSTSSSPVLKKIADGQPKLIKTNGTGQYANVRCSLLDKAGNLWFGTTGEGVYRYDGQVFTQYTTEDGLNSNTILSLLEDKRGTIWVGTDNDACRYDGKIFTYFPISTPLGSPFGVTVLSDHDPYAKNEVWSMMQDKSGTIWFGARAGVYCYNGKVLTQFPDKNIVNDSGLGLKMVDGIIEDSKGNIWFASGMIPGSEGLCRYDGKSLVSFKPGGEVWIRYVVEDKSGNLWLGTRHKGVWRYDGNDFTRFMEGEDIGLAALVTKSGDVWFSGGEKRDGYSSDGSVWRYDGKSLKNISTNSLDNYGVWTMIEDRSGNIWFGTRNNGLYRYNGKTFTRFSE